MTESVKRRLVRPVVLILLLSALAGARPLLAQAVGQSAAPEVRRGGGEASLVLPDLSTVDFGGIDGRTLLMGGLDRDSLESVLEQWGAYADEFRAIEQTEVIRLGSGHWPQFSMPALLAELISEAASR